MNKVWIGFLLDHTAILVTIFIVLYCCELFGFGVFSFSSYILLCPILIATSIEGPIICEARKWRLGSERRGSILREIFAASLFGLILALIVFLLERVLKTSHPLALFSFEPIGPKTGLLSLEEGWLLAKLQFGVCGIGNALYHSVCACIRKTRMESHGK